MTFTLTSADGPVVSFALSRMRYVSIDTAVGKTYGMPRDGYKTLTIGLDGNQRVEITLVDYDADEWYQRLVYALT